MDRPIRCAIIGCGVIAPTHAESFLQQQDVELAWACDLVEDKARRLAEKYGIGRVTTDYREVLADDSVDCVAVCTDHASHSPITVMALDSGKHVLCEKALAAGKEGMDAMFAAHARNENLVFSGIFQHRFESVWRYLKRLVAEGAFGDILTACLQMRCLRTREYYRADEWRGTWAAEGGAVLINQAIHHIDLLAWIMGGVESLSGVHSNITHGSDIETEDTAAAALRFRCGALGTMEVTSSSHLGWEPSISIQGTIGSIDVRQHDIFRVIFKDKARQSEILDKLSACRDAQGGEAGKTYYGAGHVPQIADFVEAIRQGRQPFVPAGQARHAVDIVLAIYESHQRGGWVKINNNG
ncbi:MAG: Gfo/Idh/MocA family oxidoreductase [Phycisphaerae bacterium]|nr:Gfo/Idh/MocA family oxidoreductase [Phycisphaerae bacterium]